MAKKFLTTRQAATRLQLTERAVRELCRKGQLKGAVKKHKNGPWRIPVETVEDWEKRISSQRADKADNSTLSSSLNKLRDHPVITLAGVLVVIIGVISAAISGAADWGLAGQQIQDSGLISAIRPAGEGEILIVVASFYHSDGVPNTEPHLKIKRAIEQTAVELDLDDRIRVEIDPRSLRQEDLEAAQRMAERYNALVVIWGENTGLDFAVRYLSPRDPSEDLRYVPLDEFGTGGRTPLVSMAEYADFTAKVLHPTLTSLSFLTLGNVLIFHEQYDDALSALETARVQASSIPDDDLATNALLAEVYNSLGYVNSMLGDDEVAIAHFDQTLAIRPGQPSASLSRGATLLKQGDLEAALDDFDRGISLAEQEPDKYGFSLPILLGNRAMSYWLQGDYVAALEDSNRSISLCEQNLDECGDALPLLYANRAMAQIAQDEPDLEAAKADTNTAIAMNPNLGFAYANRGELHLIEGDAIATTRDLEKAIDLDASLAPSLYEKLGDASFLQENIDQAFKYYDLAVAQYPTPRAYGRRGELSTMYYDDNDAAIRDFTEAIKLDPNYFRAVFNRGAVYSLQGEYEKAIADLSRAIQLDPTEVNAYNNRGVTYTKQKEWNKAIKDFNQVISINPEFAGAYANLGDVYFQLGSYPKALFNYKQYLRLWPDAENRELIEETIRQIEIKIEEKE